MGPGSDKHGPMGSGPAGAAPVGSGLAGAAPGLQRVVVLLASYNGLAWLPEQLDSILSQTGVELEVVVSDDVSTDGTWQWWQERAAADDRLRLLPQPPATLGSAQNFYRLLDEIDVQPGDLVALADQDDVWLPGKLASQVQLLASGAVDGVSSNVTAFGADGSRVLLRKDWPQRRFDFLCEGPGPGCTFVLSARLVHQVQGLLRAPGGAARSVDFHDWLIYGVCRASGWTWSISSSPTVDYRQHDSQALGAHLGLRQTRHRLGLVRASWHRDQARAMAAVALEVAPPEARAALERMHGLFADRRTSSRVRLVLRAPLLRRRPRDRMAIAMLVAAGLW